MKAYREDKVRILEAPGVHSIVGVGREPISLPHHEMEALRRGVRLLNVEPHPYLKVGEKVLIRKGPLEGMTGIVVRQKNNVRVILSIDLIMKSISVDIDGKDLELVGQPSSTYEYACP